MIIRTLAAAAVLTLSGFATAQANTTEDIKTCIAAMKEKTPDAEFSFKKKSGASVSKLKFEMKTADGSTKDVVCKVRRGEVLELDMDV